MSTNERRNGSGAYGTAVPSPPAQPRGSGRPSARPLGSARSTTSGSGVPPPNGPLIASVLGSYAYHQRSQSPGPQRTIASSPQHVTQRSASASLQRASSGRGRTSHTTHQIASKPLFAAYGLQYSSNGRNGMTGLGSAGGSRPGASMSPYRSRPSSSTAPAASAAAAAMGGRPATSQAPTRPAGDNWFGNTKLSATLPGHTHETARVVHELGHLLNVFAPAAPGAGPGGAKAASFRASKYTGGSGGAGHKEAWVSSGGGMDPSSAAAAMAGMLRPVSAASSNGSGGGAKPMMAAYMSDLRNSHGHGANLSLMRLQQQQAGYGSGGSSSGGGGPPPSQYGQQQQMSYGQQQSQQQAYAQYQQQQSNQGQYMHSAYAPYQQGPGGSYGGGAGANGGAYVPPRLSLAAGGAGGGGSPMASPKDPGSASSHGANSNATSPYAPGGSTGRPWETAPASSQGYPHPPPPSKGGYAPSARPPSSSGAASGQNHYLPYVHESIEMAPGAMAAGAPAFAPAPLPAPAVTHAHSPHHGPHTVAAGFSSTAPASLAFSQAMASAAAAAMGQHPPSAPLPVPSATGPVPQPPPSMLPPAPHSAPLHIPPSAQPPSQQPPYQAPAQSSAQAAAQAYASRGVRESLLASNTSSGNMSNSSSSQAFVAAASANGGVSTSAPNGTTPASGLTLRGSTLANAPHPVGLPPPSPVKAAPPSAGPGPGPPSRGGFTRSASSRSSNGSAADYAFNSILSNAERMQEIANAQAATSGSAAAAASGGAGQGADEALHISSVASIGGPSQAQPGPTTPTRPGTSGAMSGDGTQPIAIPGSSAANGAPASPIHVTWGTGVGASAGAGVGSVPGTPTRATGGPYSLSYSDLATRRASTGSTLGMQFEVGSPGFGRGSEAFSRMQLADQHGTLTCVRPSTVPSNFAADSQPDIGMYSGMMGDAPMSPTPDSMTEPRNSVGQAPWHGVIASSAAGVAPGSPRTRMGQWRPSADGIEGGTGSGGSSSAAVSSGPGHQQQESAWGRSRDATPTRPYGRPTTPSLQQAQQQAGHMAGQQASASASEAAAAASVAAAAAAAASAAVQQAAAAAVAAMTGPSTRGEPTSPPTTSQSRSASQAQSQQQQAAQAHSAQATPAPTPASVPLPTDQPLRPKTAGWSSPADGEARGSGVSSSAGVAAAMAAAATPATAPTPAARSSSAAPAVSPASAAPATPSPAAASASAAPAQGSSSPPGAAGAPTTGPSSPAGTSAAGSAVSATSTSSGSGTAGSTASTTVPGSTASGSSATASSSSGQAPTAAAAAASLQHSTSARRSLAPRFNPATVLGCEPDPTFGSLLPGYSMGKVIGEGGFCQVRLAVHHLSQRKVAVKVIDRAKLVDPNEAKRMQREIRVMKHLSHQCVIKLFEVIESPRHLFLVMEHAPAGSLLDYVRARKRLPESDACVFFQQIVASLEYCHSREVVHRDIKLENILLDVDQRMKLIDFGLSAFYVPGKRLRVHCGSPSYAAPEIVARKAYEGPPVDVWSLGVVLFAMVAGYLPFHASGGNKQELCNKIMAGTYTAPDWLSSSMKDLLARMLTTDPDKRITFQQVWQHSWVRNGPQWHERGVNCYEVVNDPSAPGGLRCDEQVVGELEAAGYPRSTLVQHLGAGEANHLTASYFLLCESKADAMRRLRASTSSGRSSGASASTSMRSAPASFAVGAHGTVAGSTAVAAAVAKARESPGRGSGSSRPGTATGGGGAGYSSGRSSHRDREDVAVGGHRMAVVV